MSDDAGPHPHPNPQQHADGSEAERFVADHVRRFNLAVGACSWDVFVQRFTDDAVLDFVGVPAGPFVGRVAIAEAYSTAPPDDTIRIVGPVAADGDELIVTYAWVTTGAFGEMRFTVRDGRVAKLVVTFL